MSPVQSGKRLFTRALRAFRSESRNEDGQNNADQTPVDLSAVAELPGFIGACLVDSRTHTIRQCQIVHDKPDLESAAINNIEVLRMIKRTITSLNLDVEIDDILISLVDQHHLIRPLKNQECLFVYIILDKSSSNLGMTKILLRQLD